MDTGRDGTPPTNAEMMQRMLTVIQNQQAIIDGWTAPHTGPDRAEVAAVEGEDGARDNIYGYNHGAELTAEESSYRVLLMGLSMTRPSANEFFRQGYHSIEVWDGLDKSQVRGVVKAVNINKSPKCPIKEDVFVSNAITDKLMILVTWIQLRALVGGAKTAVAWNANPHAAMVGTKRRMEELEGIMDSRELS